MTISTLAGVKAGLRPTEISQTNGGVCYPGAWSSGYVINNLPHDTTLNGVIISNGGVINFIDPPSGSAYLAKLLSKTIGNVTNSFMINDRLWHNGGINITSTSLQAIASPTWPARDENGQTNGVGVLLGLEISAGTGSGTPTITVGYTNSAGVSGRTGTTVFPTDNNMQTSTFLPISLQAGDVGVRSVQSITLSNSWTSGTINLVAFRHIGILASHGNDDAAVDAITFGMPKLFNGTSLGIFNIANGSTGINGVGNKVTYAFG